MASQTLAMINPLQAGLSERSWLGMAVAASLDLLGRTVMVTRNTSAAHLFHAGMRSVIERNRSVLAIGAAHYDLGGAGNLCASALAVRFCVLTSLKAWLINCRGRTDMTI